MTEYTFTLTRQEDENAIALKFERFNSHRLNQGLSAVTLNQFVTLMILDTLRAERDELTAIRRVRLAGKIDNLSPADKQTVLTLLEEVS